MAGQHSPRGVSLFSFFLLLLLPQLVSYSQPQPMVHGMAHCAVAALFFHLEKLRVNDIYRRHVKFHSSHKFKSESHTNSPQREPTWRSLTLKPMNVHVCMNKFLVGWFSSWFATMRKARVEYTIVWLKALIAKIRKIEPLPESDLDYVDIGYHFFSSFFLSITHNHGAVVCFGRLVRVGFFGGPRHMQMSHITILIYDSNFQNDFRPESLLLIGSAFIVRNLFSSILLNLRLAKSYKTARLFDPTS